LKKPRRTTLSPFFLQENGKQQKPNCRITFLGNWRFGQVKGFCAANVPCPNCGGDKTPQRAFRPTGVLRSPSRQQAAKQLPCVMRTVWPMREMFSITQIWSRNPLNRMRLF